MKISKAIQTLETKLKSLQIETKIWKEHPKTIAVIKDEIAEHEAALKILNNHNKS